MMTCRFFMAMAEAGYGPGLPYLLSFFYMRSEIGLRCGIFLSAAPFATCFAGALAYGITSGHSALTNWKLLFLVEGLPSIVMAFLAFFFLPDSPEKARFLNEGEEKEVAKARAIRQVGQEGSTRVGGISFKEVGAALLDLKNWLTAVR
jgi:MFS family permease